MRALILAAGKGTRMRSQKSKVLHEIMGRPMIGCVLDVLESLQIKKTAVVVGAHADQVRDFLSDRYAKRSAQKPDVILQSVQQGTGHAVMIAKKFFSESSDDLLVWPGDMPLLQTETLREFIKKHQDSKAVVSVLSAVVDSPNGYGRILRSNDQFFAIREELDATEAEKKVQEINTGVYLFQTKALVRALGQLKPANAKKEYYLTDTIEILSSEGCLIEAFPLAGNGEADGINSREQLASAIQKMNCREVLRHMESGVTVVNPEQTYIEPGVRVGSDTVIYPWCFIESGVEIGKNCQIGPFAKIRKGSRIGDDAIIGSFVEVNRSKIGSGVSAKHLAYLGDATIGAGTNIGAGTITANYDGKNKHQTIIGKRVMVGSNTVLVAPVTLEDDVKTGAGSVVPGRSRVKKGTTVVGVPAKVLTKSKKS